MANYTPNLNLRKPLTTEKYDVVADLNDTKDKIDTHAGAVAGQINAINTEIAKKASKVDLDVTDSRIDNLIATAGDGSVPSELTDIRVGADAVTYPTAGAAVRDQFSAVNAQLAETASLIKTGKNLFDKSTITSGYYINGVGALVAGATMFVSDYIPVKPSVAYTKKYVTGAVTYYDKGRNRIGYQVPVAVFTTIASAEYVRFNGLLSEIDSEQLEEGIVSTIYEPYGLKFKNTLAKSIPLTSLDVDDYTLKSDAYPFQAQVTLKTNGGVDVSAALKKAIKKIELYGADTAKKYSLNYIQKNYLTYGTGIVLAECNTNGSYKNDAASNTVIGFVAPTGVSTFELFEANNSGVRARIWIDWAEIPDNTQYVVRSYAQSGLDERVKVPTIQVNLPSVINAVIGDTIELFYKGIVQAIDPLKYNIIVSASKGNAYKNRWIYTPQAGDVNFNLTVTVTDEQYVKLASKTAQVKVISVKPSPTTLKNVLCVGDSLTQAGTWVREVDRRLTESGGAPAGNNLSNINFIGKKLNGTSGYEGTGGWTWQNYTSNYPGNPFWDTTLGRLNFTKYCADNGFPGIDYCVILLGWNNSNLTGDQIVVEGKKFVDALHAEYPSAKVVISGLQVPNIDGLGENYGSSESWNYYLKLLKVFEFNKSYESWTKEAAYSAFMSFVHLSSQFDVDNNMPMATRPVNIRSSKTELYGVNGVHPEYEGYMQIADAMYRKLMDII